MRLPEDQRVSPTSPLKRGDLVLAPFPFTDLSAVTYRPAVILTPDPMKLPKGHRLGIAGHYGFVSDDAAVVEVAR